MNFSLEIRDTSLLVVACDPGCEGAVQILGPGGSSAQQQPHLPDRPSGCVVLARLSRDPEGRFILRLSCDSADSPAPRVSAIDNGVDHLSSQEDAEATKTADAAALDDEAEKVDEAEGQRASSESVEAQPTSSSYASALEEFVATERTYVRRLALVFDSYYPGLLAAVQARQLGCCGPDDLKRVFGHFQGMRLLHEQLLSDLMESGMLGKLMAQYAHQLKSYGTYYSTFPQITATVRGWMTDESFRQVFAQLRQQCADPAESQLDLRALLLEPVQRPMRYPMLLDRYLEEIGSCHPDSSSARRAADTVVDALRELEKSLRDFSAFQDRLQLLRSVVFPTGLASHWEEFAHSCIRHGRARQGDKQRYLLLSKHTLLICSPGRFRQETWAAKRAIPVPGDLRVLGCEGNRLRMDTARDPQLQLAFGEATDGGGGDGGGDGGVRECRDWAMELRRLGVPFMDSPLEGDDRLMPWERAAAGRSGRPVMTPLDKVSRCQGCGSACRRLQRRKLSCRVCGGAFCSDCTDYQASTNWGGDRPLRCCLFCRVASGADPAELATERHRDVLARFRAVRELDANPATLAGPLAAWVSGRWVALWCRADSEGRQLALYRHRRDFLPQLTIERPSLGVGDTAAAPPAELLVHDHQRRRTCRLRASGDSGGSGGLANEAEAAAEAAASASLIGRLADLLGRCASSDSEAAIGDCTDGRPRTPSPPPSMTSSDESDGTPPEAADDPALLSEFS